MFLVSACGCLCAIYWSQVLSWEWRCSWSSADRWCTNYRDVASERPGGAAPPGNLQAPPGNFAHHTFLGTFKPPTNLLATYNHIGKALYAPNNQIMNFTYNNNTINLFTWLKRCIYRSEHLPGISCTSRNVFSGYIPELHLIDQQFYCLLRCVSY